MSRTLVLHPCSPAYAVAVAVDLAQRSEVAFHPASQTDHQASADRLADGWIDSADRIIVYADIGIDEIDATLQLAESLGVEIEYRTVGPPRRTGIVDRIRRIFA